MPLPSHLVYNELDGEEIREILTRRFVDLLSSVVYLQRHITLPHVRMRLSVVLESYAEKRNPDTQTINDVLDITTSVPADDSAPAEVTSLSLDINAAPMPGGQPPDQIRDEHGLGTVQPSRVKHLPFTEDRLTGRTVESSYGKIDRTGESGILPNATVVKQDFGRAGLAHGGARERLSHKQHGGSDGSPLPPNWEGER